MVRAPQKRRGWTALLMVLAWAAGPIRAADRENNGPILVTTLPHPQEEPLEALQPLPAPPPCVLEDCNGPLLIGDPLLDSPSFTPGWFTAAEVSFVRPSLNGRLAGVVPFLGLLDLPAVLPFSGQCWTAAPRVELGYRFAEGCGELLLSYRFLYSDGCTGPIPVDPIPRACVYSEVNLNALDLDYANHEFSLGPCWDMKWQVGVRLAEVYCQTSANGSGLDRWADSDFIGAGPHVALSLTRWLPNHRFGLFGRVEGSALFGRVSQNFEDVVRLFGVPVLAGTSAQNQSQAVPVLRVQAGLRWLSPWCGGRLHFAGGYEFEEWWHVGRAEHSRMDLLLQGLFVRCEWNF